MSPFPSKGTPLARRWQWLSIYLFVRQTTSRLLLRCFVDPRLLTKPTQKRSSFDGKLGLSPPNVKFEVDDIEDSWTYTRPFDYIHSRMMNSSICKWDEYLRQSYKHLNPGGWLELQEFHLPVSDDGTLAEDGAIHRSMRLLGEAAAKTDGAFVDLDALKPMMEAVGFVDVAEVRFKWPSNTWPRDGRYKELGSWNHENITRGLQGFLMAALTRGLGWHADEVNVPAAQARKDIGDRSIHAYWPMIVV
ncbi:uncharacterized protein GLRG_07201 [Colletotrichum graminicola M1.001]|uniref:Methyltransferase domain-containing protein n=1 Tax=Colletotrichum graminicola (strain M1.001 / M2 / FGSC 10212) TaxID=645133 RepID=E3QMG9_COLGM|nr:uncharacterized protein GLRG_07201 [Colletotrichum graminicola M1.001]EFQ32057.1 hypothetical protein GLRG_07201 [Colletotrichum graminicola M1.001]